MAGVRFGIGLPSCRTPGTLLAVTPACSDIVADVDLGPLCLLDDLLELAALLPVDVDLKERRRPRFRFTCVFPSSLPPSLPLSESLSSPWSCAPSSGLSCEFSV